LVSEERYFDIASGELFSQFLRDVNPDCVIHLAAEALVRRAQDQPVNALSSNVLGTAKVLQALAELDSRPVVLVATTDKVYKESELPNYRNVETDSLLGSEVYSHSKVAADVMTQSYMHSLGAKNWAVVRAGNVIGGGDLSPDRLMPDLIRSHFQTAQPLVIRNPLAVRPWQHVLDCLWGYVSVVRHLDKDPGSSVWNFGPNEIDIASVSEVIEIAQEFLPSLQVELQDQASPSHHEAKYLSLDSSKARKLLDWKPEYSLRESISKTIEWEERVVRGATPRDVTQRQVEEFLHRVGNS
jgi:CDP-glucose 4,6-dehydratase